MNATLTGLGLALVAALIAALIGPFFIDWSDYRTEFEQQAGRITGVPVRVTGDVDARLLPSPRVRFGGVRIGADGEQSALQAGELTLDLALTPLLSGQYRVTKLTIGGAELTASIGQNGEIRLPIGRSAVTADLGRIAIEDIAVNDARILLHDEASDRTFHFDGVNLSGQASALSGPFKLNASGRGEGVPFDLRVSTGSFASGTGRTNLALRAEGKPSLDVDGNLRLQDGRPVLSGKADITAAAAQNQPAPWRIGSEIEAEPHRIAMKTLDLLYGAEGQGLRLNGQGDIALGAQPRANLALKARQFDLDRALARPADAPTLTPAEAVQAYLDDLPALSGMPFAIQGSVDIGSLVLGSDVITGLRADLASTAQGWEVRSFDAQLPGGGAVFTKGALTVNEWSPPAYEGQARLTVSNLPSLLRWAGGGTADQARPDIGVRTLNLSGDVQVRPGASAVHGMKLGLDNTEIQGRVTWRQEDDAPLRLEADLRADELDLDALDIKRLLAWLDKTGGGTPEFQIALRAEHLVYAKVPGRGIDADLTIDREAADIRRLIIADLGGSRLEAEGRLPIAEGGHGAKLNAKIAAQSLDGAVQVLRSLPVPPALVTALSRRGEALAPLNLTAALSSDDTGRYALRLSGIVGGTDLDIDATSKGLAWAQLQSARLAAMSGDGARLLQQMGLPLVNPEPQGDSRAELSLSQDGARGLAVEGTLLAAGSRIDLRGRTDEEFLLRGHAEVNAEDASRFAILLGRVAPGVLPVLPVSLTGDVTWKDETVSASLITGFVGGRASSGRLEYNPKSGIAGDVDLTSVSLLELVGAAVGPLALSENDETGWPSGPIGQGLFDGLQGRIGIRTGAFELAPGYIAGKAGMNLVLSPNEFALQDVSAVLAGGAVTGSVIVRKAGKEASVSGRVALAGGSLADLVTKSEGQPVAVGRLDVMADAVGSGASLSAMAQGLTGSGTFQIRNARLRGLDAGAFSRVMRSLEEKAVTPDELDVMRRFTAELAAGDLPVEDVTSAFTMASGTMRISNAAVQSEAASASASADIDLARDVLAASITLRPSGMDAVAGAAAPQVALRFDGSIRAPARSIDTTAFTSFLTVRALDREMKRVQQMEHDQRERTRRAEEAARLKAINESTGTVPLGELPPPVQMQRPQPRPQPAPQQPAPQPRRQFSPFDVFRGGSPQPAR
ncbi:AsmA family protein [Terrihabitans sp. B22-R8]|uniref:AsmA family protein n=1 Tax=Terrihabitans sp. B22-R8 TaxID=3425128 RepID=UPI00403CB7E2